MRRGAIFVAAVLWGIVPAMAGPREDLAAEAFPVLEKGTRSGDMLARAKATEALARLPGHDVMPYLREALRDPHWPVRRSAIVAMASLGNGEARTLAAQALRDPSVTVAEDLPVWILAFPDASGRALVADALADPQNPNREALWKALLAQGIEAALPFWVPALARQDEMARKVLQEMPSSLQPAWVAALLREKSPVVLGFALEMAREGDLPVPAPLLKPLLKGKDNGLRTAAAEILARQGDPEGTVALLPLAEGDEPAKARFLRAATTAPSPAALPALKKMASAEIPESLLPLAYRAFAASGDETLRQRVEQDITSTLPPRRLAAVGAVARLWGTRGLPRIHQLLGDGSATVRRLAAEALGNLGQAESVEPLERAVRDTDRDVRIAVVGALARIRDKAVIPVASYLIYDRDMDIRRLAAQAICQARHDSAIPILRILLEDRDPTVRGPVMVTLASLDPKQGIEIFPTALPGLTPEALLALVAELKEGAVPFLRKAVQSDREWARQAAIEAVAHLPAQEEEFLRETVAQSAYPETRQQALTRLLHKDCGKALDLARQRLEDPAPEVRVAALRGIGACGTEEDIPLVRKTLLDLEEYVRVVGATTLLSFPKGPAPKAPASQKKTRSR